MTTVINSPDDLVLEKAAKYICNVKCGLCPMVVEGTPCFQKCGLDTLPWQCWLFYFKELAAKAGPADPDKS